LIGVWWALRPVATGNLFLCATAVAILCSCDSLHGAVRQMNDFMIARGMTAKKLDSSQFLEGSFLEALK
jgi:hypothetical protein